MRRDPPPQSLRRDRRPGVSTHVQLAGVENVSRSFHVHREPRPPKVFGASSPRFWGVPHNQSFSRSKDGSCPMRLPAMGRVACAATVAASLKLTRVALTHLSDVPINKAQAGSSAEGRCIPWCSGLSGVGADPAAAGLVWRLMRRDALGSQRMLNTLGLKTFLGRSTRTGSRSHRKSSGRAVHGFGYATQSVLFTV
jgi:hypothetical protein